MRILTFILILVGLNAFGQNLADTTITDIETDLFKELTIRPNPMQNYCLVEGYTFESYSISDLTGRVVHSGIFSNLIPVDKLSEGLYFIHLNDRNVIVNRRLMIKR